VLPATPAPATLRTWKILFAANGQSPGAFSLLRHALDNIQVNNTDQVSAPYGGRITGVSYRFGTGILDATTGNHTFRFRINNTFTSTFQVNIPSIPAGFGLFNSGLSFPFNQGDFIAMEYNAGPSGTLRMLATVFTEQ
jgi:hypothetical protein